MPDGKWIANLTPDMSLTEAARHVLLVRLQVVADALPKALFEAEGDPEHVHQLRVGTRRGAAALRIFRHCLPQKVFKRARQRLRRLRRAAGVVRDWDVFLIDLGERGKEKRRGEQAGLDFLMGYGFGQRAAAQVELEEAGRREGPRFDRFLLETAASVFAHHPRDSKKTLLDLARPLLTDLLQALDRVLDGDLEDNSHLHQVRIAGKRLRYAMEIFVDCYDQPFRDVLYPLVEEMQEILGRLNDSRVAADRLAALRERLLAEPLVEWKRLKTGIEKLLQSHVDRLSQERGHFQSWLERWRQAEPEGMLDKLVKTAD